MHGILKYSETPGVVIPLTSLLTSEFRTIVLEGWCLGQFGAYNHEVKCPGARN